MNRLVTLSAVFAVAFGAPSEYAALPGVVAPAPYSTAQVISPATKALSQGPAVIEKQTHLGSQTYISGYSTDILKPPTPVLPIAVPTVLKGTTSINAPIVKTVTEIHTVNEPVPVERRVEVPYDVPVPVERIVEVPVEVRVAKPYPVAVPTPVQGAPIINKKIAPIVRNTHHNIVSQPALAVAGYAAAAPIGYAGYAAAATPLGYAAAAPIAVAGH